MTTRDLSDQEIDTLIMSLAVARGGEGFTQEEAEAVMKWANQVRFDAALLEAVLTGYMLVDWRNGEIAFKLTKTGERRARQLVKLAKNKKGR